MERVLLALSGPSPASEFVAALDTLWTSETDDFRGEYFVVSARRATSPRQGSCLPKTLSMFSAAAVQPARALLDGTDAMATPPASAGLTLALLRQAVRVAGPSYLVVARLSVAPGGMAGRQRALLCGPAGWIAEDLVAIRDAGVSHLAIDLAGRETDIPLSAAIERMTWFRELAEVAIGRRVAAAA